jgi:hypothetical protein
VMVDIDDTIIEVHGYAKQGSGYGYSGVRGLNALLGTVTTTASAPVVVAAQRLRKGSCGSPRGAARLVADALKTVNHLTVGTSVRPLMRADSAFYGYATAGAAIRGGADVSVTVRMDPKVKAAIATIGEDAWTPIEYTDAVFDEQTQTGTSRAEVAEIPFTAFTPRNKAEHVPVGSWCAGSRTSTPRATMARKRCSTPGASTSSSPPPTTTRLTPCPRTRPTVGQAIIEQLHADLKNAALAHLPSGKFTANAAWLVLAVMAFNLTRAAATITGPGLAKATTATIRRKLIAVPARVASSARRVTLHLPAHWPWETAWSDLFNRAWGPPPASMT